MVEPRGRPWGSQTLAGQGQLRNKVPKPWQLEKQKPVFLLSEAWKPKKVLAVLAFISVICNTVVKTRVWAC